MKKRTIRDIEFAGKTALVRVDFNVPMDKAGEITDDNRIRAALPTINHLLEHGARVVLMSHLGRPGGQVVKEYSLAPVASRLQQLLRQPVKMVDDCVGKQVQDAVAELRAREVLLLENMRFHKEEEENDPAFARSLAALGDVFVNDAFGTAHRAHASTAGVADYLPAVAGLLMEKEIQFLGEELEDPKRPFVALIGGAKVSTKIGVLEHLLDKVDHLLIGGAMANTLLLAQGKQLGKSLVEEDKVPVAQELLGKAGAKLVLPVDVLVAEKVEHGASSEVVKVDAVPAHMAAVDIGPETAELYTGLLKKAGTVVWNGPMGVFEVPDFAQGTRAMAKALAESEAISIVGGGDSVAALEQMGLSEHFTHLSTGGGASLEFLEGKTLPGIEVLLDA